MDELKDDDSVQHRDVVYQSDVHIRICLDGLSKDHAKRRVIGVLTEVRTSHLSNSNKINYLLRQLAVWLVEQAMKTQTGSRGIALLFLQPLR